MNSFACSFACLWLDVQLSERKISNSIMHVGFCGGRRWWGNERNYVISFQHVFHFDLSHTGMLYPLNNCVVILGWRGIEARRHHHLSRQERRHILKLFSIFILLKIEMIKVVKKWGCGGQLIGLLLFQ